MTEGMWALRREISFSRKASRQFRDADLALVAGSSQFIEAYGGHWGFPWTLLRWTLLGLFNRVPVYFLSMGAEPVHGRISRWMIKQTARLATGISVRDPVSGERLAELGVRRELQIVPDLGLGFEVPEVDSPRDRSLLTVGINTIPYFHQAYWRASDPVRYESYIEALATFCEVVLGRGDGLVLYGTTEWADRIATENLSERIRQRVGEGPMERLEAPESRCLDDLWRILSGLDYTVAARYHGVITALVMNKPVISMAYEQKSLDVMAMMGVGRYGTDIPAATGEWLISTFEHLEQHREEVETSLRVGVAEARRAVNQQFEDVLSFASCLGGNAR